MTSHETWRAVPGYEGIYEVSDAGRVRSLDRLDNRGRRTTGRVLAERPLRDGRVRVSLAKNGQTVDGYVYRLVLEAFVGPCPEGMEALHWDDVRSNNTLSNLRWGTRTENMRDMSRNGRGNIALTHCPQGHPYDEANTYYYPTGRQHRLCRACQREHRRRRRERARQEVAA